MEDYIFISGNVPSSKNSRVFNMAMKRSFASKTTQTYIRKSKQEYLDNKEAFLKLLEGKEKPLLIGLHFVRESRRRWDFINMCQVVFDLMVEYGWIEDDNTKEILPMPLLINETYETHDKFNPGVYITIL